MKRKVLSILIAGAAVLAFGGCQNELASVSETTFTSIQPEPSSSVSSSVTAASSETSSASSSDAELPGQGFSLDDVAFSSGEETVISYPSEMFSTAFIWLDPTHIYLEPENGVEFALIADIENRTFTQAPVQRARLEKIAYGDDSISLFLSDDALTLQKRDKNFNLISSVSFASEAEKYNYVCAVEPASESLYYIQQDDPQKPVLCRKRGGKDEVIKELPALGDKEFYDGLDVSPSGDKVFFYKVYYEMLVKYIYIYDIKTGAMTETTHHYEGAVSPGFWMPEGVWMGEQPVFLLHHEYDSTRCSEEIRYGIPPEMRTEVLFDPDSGCQATMANHRGSSWSCVIFSAYLAQPYTCRDILFYFKDGGTYLSHAVDKNCYYPQLSPDEKYLAYSSYAQGREDVKEIAILPTGNLWKPLDWAQVQAEMDGAFSEMSARNEKGKGSV